MTYPECKATCKIHKATIAQNTPFKLWTLICACCITGLQKPYVPRKETT